MRPGPPGRHHDLRGLTDRAFAAAGRLAARHPLRAIVPAGHGSGGVLVSRDPDEGGDGAALPMPGYEEPFPPALDAACRPLTGTFPDRGSAVMMGPTRQARQLWRMQAEAPAAVAAAAHYLSVPQDWAGGPREWRCPNSRPSARSRTSGTPRPGRWGRPAASCPDGTLLADPVHPPRASPPGQKDGEAPPGPVPERVAPLAVPGLRDYAGACRRLARQMDRRTGR